MNYYNYNHKHNTGQRNYSQNDGQQFNSNQEQIPLLKNDENYEEVKKFLENMENFTRSLSKDVKYSKVRKYYDKMLKVLKKADGKSLNKLKAHLELEVGLLIEYDIGREKKNSPSRYKLEKIRNFFKGTLELLKGEDYNKAVSLFEKNWEVFVAYARKNLSDK